MPATRFAKLTRGFLYLLIASIGLGAILAMGIVVAGNWSWFEARILLTTGTVAGASICGMASGAALSRSRSAALPAIGIGLALLAAALLIAGMWFEVGSGDYWRFTASVAIFAAAVAHVSVLSLARLHASHGWVQYVAYGAALLFATLLVAIITSSSGGSEGMMRALAVLGIVDVALSLVVPIVHVLDRRAPVPSTLATAEPMGAGTDALTAIDEEIVRLRARIGELERRRALLQDAAAPRPVR